MKEGKNSGSPAQGPSPASNRPLLIDREEDFYILGKDSVAFKGKEVSGGLREKALLGQCFYKTAKKLSTKYLKDME